MKKNTTHSVTWTLVSGAFFLTLGLCHAAPNRISVTLFGQSCQMSGPYSSETLKWIHSVSPEKIPVDISDLSARSTQTLLKNIPKGKLPSQLESYLDRQRRRFDAWVSFFDALKVEASQRTVQGLLTSIKPYLRDQDELSLKDLAERWAKDWTNALSKDQFIEALRGKYPADPEAEFHKIIRRLKVRYNCAFEEE